MTYKKVTIREARPDDAQNILDFLKVITNETNNLLLTPDEISKKSLNDEVIFLKKSLESSIGIFLLAIEHDKIIGTANMQSSIRHRISHRGALGMSVLKKYSGKGVGSQLLAEIITYAKHIGLEILELEVRADNLPAIHLYKKFGFKEYGLYKHFMKIDNHYYDGLLMSLNLNEVLQLIT